jgi:hypothetical protein
MMVVSGHERVITMAISLDEKWISELTEEAQNGVPEDVKFRRLDESGRAAELAAMHDMPGFWSGSGCPAVGLEDCGQDTGPAYGRSGQLRADEHAGAGARRQAPGSGGVHSACVAAGPGC